MATSPTVTDVEKGTIMEHYGMEKPIRTQTIVADPAPLGLTAFALTTFVLSCQNAGVLISRSASHSLVTGVALGYGGLVQLLAGMWEFAAGNTFGATAFSSYAAFWFSFAVIQIPGFGVRAAFEASGTLNDFHQALGLWLLGWAIFTFVMWMATLRTNVCLAGLFFTLFVTFILLSVGDFTNDDSYTRAGGIAGIATAFMAWYLAMTGLVKRENSLFTLPVGKLSPSGLRARS